MNASSVFAAALALLLAPLCHGAEPKEKQSEQTSAAPTKVEEVYTPKDLEDAFEHLKKILSPDALKEFRESKEEDLPRFHHGLGTGIRNSWGLWGESSLAKYFNDLKIHHPDDMSGIILTSFWRHLNDKPVQLEEQIAYYQKYWEDEKKAEKLEAERVRQAKRRIYKMMMGLSLSKKELQHVKMPNRTEKDLRVRFLAPFRNGVFLAVRFPAGIPGLVDKEDHTEGYFVDLVDQEVRPIRVPEVQDVRSAVVAGGHAWFLGKTDGKIRLLGISDKERVNIPLPEAGDGIPQLGIVGTSLLTVYPEAVYRRDGDKWTQLYAGTLKLPRSGPPPQLLGNRLFFRDEGRGENAKRLWWLEIGQTPKLTSIDEDIGLVGSEGPRWENSFSYCVTPSGDLWATLGEGGNRQSLVKKSATGEYRIAIMNNSLRFDGDLFGSDSADMGLSISAVTSASGSELLLVGDRGLYRLKDRQLVQEVAFENTHQKIPVDNGQTVYHWSWNPSRILVLGEYRYLISGDFGGVYLLERNTEGNLQFIALDQNFGEPVTF